MSSWQASNPATSRASTRLVCREPGGLLHGVVVRGGVCGAFMALVSHTLLREDEEQPGVADLSQIRELQVIKLAPGGSET